MRCAITSARATLKKSGHCAESPVLSSTPLTRNEQDISVSDIFGIAASWIDERSAAARGALDSTPVLFQNCESLPFGGVLLMLPFLLETGLLDYKSHYAPLAPGYYDIDTIILLLAFMYLCRIRNPEQFKHINPGEFGKLLGLDRIPEAKCFRGKVKQICAQEKSVAWNKELAQKWSSEEENSFYYIDGHVQVYHGYNATLGKKHVSRQKLCLPGVQEFWVNNAQGMPYFYVCGQVNEKLLQMIEEQIVPRLLDNMHLDEQSHEDPMAPKMTLVFDREAYSPQFFRRLWEEHKIAVITYRKNVHDTWEEEDFVEHEVEIDGVTTKMRLSEKQVELDGVKMREVRKLSGDGHQTSILTTHPLLSITMVALYMFARWSQENFFRYLRLDYDFDKIAQYLVQQIDDEFMVVNPAHNKLEYQLKKAREKIARKKAGLYVLIEENVGSDLEQTPKFLQKKEKLETELHGLKAEENKLIESREKMPKRIKISDMEHRYTQLDMESKLFRNIIKMICYRAETSLAALLCKDYKKAFNEKRAMAKSVINTMCDLKPDYDSNILEVYLYTQATPRDNLAVEKLCRKLNENNTKFPGTELTLVYKTTSM